MIPVLPTILIDSLDAPVALLVGITHNQFKLACNILTKEERDQRIWFDCSTSDITWLNN